MAFKAPSRTNVTKAAQNARTSRGKRSNLAYLMTGLPPGGIALIYDKLHLIFRDGKYTTKSIGTYIVDPDGKIQLRNLRDSIYSVQFQSIENISHSVDVTIGNADYFQTIKENTLPYPVIITGMVNGLDISNQAYFTVYWILDSHQIDGYYQIWIKAAADSEFHIHTTIYNPRARQFNITPLDYSTEYSVAIKTTNQEGESRGFSNIASGTTVASPAGGAELDTSPPTNQTFLY